MKILVSSHLFGGVGGAERALYSVIEALSPDRVDVVVRECKPGFYAQHGSHARIFNVHNWRWRGANMSAGVKGFFVSRVVNSLRKWLRPEYDVYLQFRSGPSLGPTIRAKKRLLIPSGNVVPPELALNFDAIALQAPGNDRFVPNGVKTVLLPPPVLPLTQYAGVSLPDSTTLPDESKLPEKFFLTVFNPYGPIKGVSDLIGVVDSLPLPVVWCHSTATLDFEIPNELLNHEMVVHVDNPSHGLMEFLYRHCEAYLSFSVSEGFGWSLADALRYSPVVVSRKIGVMTFPEVPTNLFVEVGDEWRVDWEEVLSKRSPREEQLDWLSANRFRRSLEKLVE